jgi:hypothetical protein
LRVAKGGAKRVDDKPTSTGPDVSPACSVGCCALGPGLPRIWSGARCPRHGQIDPIAPRVPPREPREPVLPARTKISHFCQNGARVCQNGARAKFRILPKSRLSIAEVVVAVSLMMRLGCETQREYLPSKDERLSARAMVARAARGGGFPFSPLGRGAYRKVCLQEYCCV